MHIQQKKCLKLHTLTYTINTHFSVHTLDKVNGNYQEDLARNLHADTNALCSFNRCVLVWTFT